MKSSQIRQAFIDFFISKAHSFARPSPVVLPQDPTLLFVNAGMNQFKDVFLSTGSRAYTRAVNSQPCIRVSGKHNDLEEVGRDTYHLTLFEMLGNWSFGDYYKKEAISWAWELFTTVYKLPKDKLYATVYTTDDESIELWKTLTDIDHAKILRFEKENFWEMAETGPCGPCSEIHLDRGEAACDKQGMLGHTCSVNGDCARYIELWNLVFMQYNRTADGCLEDLPMKHVDTGMGLERLTAYLQKTNSSYDTDIFQPLISQIATISGVPYDAGISGMPHRVMSDHIRTLTFAIADNVLPSNEGRGYVLRRILRRALRYAKKLNINEPVLYKLAETVVETMKDYYTDLPQRKALIQNVIKAEEESFLRTLSAGINVFEEIALKTKAEKQNTIHGIDVFKLYDTYGFPVDLTEIMAAEQNLKIDLENFKAELDKQRAQSRKHVKLHHADDERLSRGGEAKVVTQEDERLQMAQHHSATHLLQAALRKVLGNHVQQAGSLVDTAYLRFDFTHFKQVTKEELAQVEQLANEAIHQALPVQVFETTLDDAKGLGALALFGEKYEDQVRVIKMADFSIELCGGNHVTNTSELEEFKITGEAAISAGTRRITGIVGKANIANFHQAKQQEELAQLNNKLAQLTTLKNKIKELNGTFEVKVNFDNLENLTLDQLKAKQLEVLDLLKTGQKILEKLSQAQALTSMADLSTEAHSVPNKDYLLLCKSLSNVDMQGLKTIADNLVNTLKNSVIVLAGVKEDKGFFVVKIAAQTMKNHSLTANDLIKQLTNITGGNGGGRPDMAQAGGIEIAKIDQALQSLHDFLATA